MSNILLKTDGYKPSHFLQLPPKTQGMFSYIEARKNPGVNFTQVAGTQAIVRDLFEKPISKYDIDEAEDTLVPYGVPFNRPGFEHILNKHGGFMPMRIRAVPEGTRVPNGNMLMSVESTDPVVPWVPGYFEPPVLRMWFPTTVATRSRLIKEVIRKHLLLSADDLSGLPFKLHDFGSRGVSSGESAGIGGYAHLQNFLGSDTLEAIPFIRKFYGGDKDGISFSIPASEHSTTTSWGREHEVDAYSNQLAQFGKPGAVFASVSDSYNIYDACENLWGGVLRQRVIDSGATLVIRPDSGDPVLVLPKLLAILDRRFGSKVNSKGYKVLNHVRLIQGDGIDCPGTVDTILRFVEAAGFSADNIAFGMGGGLLQMLNRDTEGFAMKCSAVNVGGEWRDVYKDPVDDAGKRSKKGRLVLWKDGDTFETARNDVPRTWSDRLVDGMETLYENGSFHNFRSLSQIRSVAA